jgi:PAS domain S-box-containing protein
LHVHEIELEVQNENLSRARAQAEASADKFSELYDLAPIGYLTLDRKGTMRQMNLSGARLLGGERARLLNRRLGLFVAQGDRLAFSAFLEKVFAGRTRKRCEVTLARGGSQPLTVQIECMRSAGGQECRAVVLDITERQQAREALQRAHDELELCVAARTEDLRRANAELRAEIAQRKQTEAALKQSEERFRHVAETAGEFIWEVDAEGLYTFASPSVERTLGYTPAELVGKKHFYDLFDPAVREELKAAAFQVFAARQAFRDFPNANVSKSGQLVHLETSGIPVLDSAGKLLGYLGTDTDVTGRKQSVLEIVQQRHELAHIARVSTLSQLASSLAHELSQPLGAILRNAEAAELFLQEPAPDLDEVRAILADIRKDDQRAGAVIDGMRALMKRREAERCRLDLNLLAGEVVTLVRLDAEMRRVRLTVETKPALPPVQGDRVQLQQVILNLLLNAMDAVNGNSPAKRLVVLQARSAGPAVEVTVSDNGHGIPADHLARVFEPFFTSRPKGLGMGLAISRSIIEVHGGRLWAENNPAGGATFTFTLPVSGAGRENSNQSSVTSDH